MSEVRKMRKTSLQAGGRLDAGAGKVRARDISWDRTGLPRSDAISTAGTSGRPQESKSAPVVTGIKDKAKTATLLPPKAPPPTKHALDVGSGKAVEPNSSPEGKSRQSTLKELCPEDKRKVKHLIEEVARLGTEKEKLQSEMTREREALEGVLERLKVKHHKVVKEKKELENELTSSQLQLQALNTLSSQPRPPHHPHYANSPAPSGHIPGRPHPPVADAPAHSYLDMRITPSKHTRLTPSSQHGHQASNTTGLGASQNVHFVPLSTKGTHPANLSTGFPPEQVSQLHNQPFVNRELFVRDQRVYSSARVLAVNFADQSYPPTQPWAHQSRQTPSNIPQYPQVSRDTSASQPRAPQSRQTPSNIPQYPQVSQDTSASQNIARSRRSVAMNAIPPAKGTRSLVPVISTRGDSHLTSYQPTGGEPRSQHQIQHEVKGQSSIPSAHPSDAAVNSRVPSGPVHTHSQQVTIPFGTSGAQDDSFATRAKNLSCATQAQAPSSGTQAQRPSLATQAQGPSLTTQAQGPSLATQAQGPSFATQAQGPSLTMQAQAPSSATQIPHGPHLAHTKPMPSGEQNSAPSNHLGAVIDTRLHPECNSHDTANSATSASSDTVVYVPPIASGGSQLPIANGNGYRPIMRGSSNVPMASRNGHGSIAKGGSQVSITGGNRHGPIMRGNSNAPMANGNGHISAVSGSSKVSGSGLASMHSSATQVSEKPVIQPQEETVRYPPVVSSRDSHRAATCTTRRQNSSEQQNGMENEIKRYSSESCDPNTISVGSTATSVVPVTPHGTRRLQDLPETRLVDTCTQTLSIECKAVQTDDVGERTNVQHGRTNMQYVRLVETEGEGERTNVQHGRTNIQHVRLVETEGEGEHTNIQHARLVESEESDRTYRQRTRQVGESNCTNIQHARLVNSEGEDGHTNAQHASDHSTNKQYVKLVETSGESNEEEEEADTSPPVTNLYATSDSPDGRVITRNETHMPSLDPASHFGSSMTHYSSFSEMKKPVVTLRIPQVERERVGSRDSGIQEDTLALSTILNAQELNSEGGEGEEREEEGRSCVFESESSSVPPLDLALSLNQDTLPHSDSHSQRTILAAKWINKNSTFSKSHVYQLTPPDTSEPVQTTGGGASKLSQSWREGARKRRRKGTDLEADPESDSAHEIVENLFFV